MKGRLILVIGPSGSGKSALLSHLHSTHKEIVFPRSCTTRIPRPGEVEGEKYFFISKAEFEKKELAGEFLEWAAFGGNYYATLKSEILPALAEGKTIVREVEVQGARQLLKLIPKEQIRTVFIDAGIWDDLEKRIRTRAPMAEVELLARRKRYEDETSFKAEADVVIQNTDGNFAEAQQHFVQAIEAIAAE
jgi:guanylate kinase